MLKTEKIMLVSFPTFKDSCYYFVNSNNEKHNSVFV